jgi:hypothetical protein
MSAPEPIATTAPATGLGPIYYKEKHTMTRKLILMVAPVLMLAAFSVMPTMASAANEAYGVCELGGTHTAECPAGEKKFTAFANGTPVKVLSEKTFKGGNFILKDEKTKAIIECEDLKDSGTFENLAGVGNSKETLLFIRCTTAVGELKCPVNTAGAGSGVIHAEVTNKVLAGGLTVEIKVPAAGIVLVFSGPPPTGCPASGTAAGTVTGSTTGTQARGSNDLVFAASKGLKFNGEESELTGNDETYTETGKPVVID